MKLCISPLSALLDIFWINYSSHCFVLCKMTGTSSVQHCCLEWSGQVSSWAGKGMNLISVSHILLQTVKNKRISYFIINGTFTISIEVIKKEKKRSTQESCLLTCPLSDQYCPIAPCCNNLPLLHVFCGYVLAFFSCPWLPLLLCVSATLIAIGP